MTEFLKLCQFSVAKSRADYDEVSHLRYLSYSKEGKLALNKSVTDMADEFDSLSVIHVVKFQSRIIGSVRVILNKETDTLSYSRSFDSPIPGLPDRKELIEASKLCIHPEFNGKGLFYPLAARMVLTAIEHEKRYILGGAVRGLVPTWERCGFIPLGMTCASKDYKGIEHHLMLMDTLNVKIGNGTHEKFNLHFTPLLQGMLSILNPIESGEKR